MHFWLPLATVVPRKRHTCTACLDPPSCYMPRSFHTPPVNHLSKVRIMELLGLKFSPFSFCLLFDIEQILPLFKAFTPAMSATQPRYRRLFSGIKPSSGEIKNEWESAPLYVFMMCTGTNLPWLLGPNAFSNVPFSPVLALEQFPLHTSEHSSKNSNDENDDDDDNNNNNNSACFKCGCKVAKSCC